MKKITEYNPASALINTECIAHFLNDALATEDAAYIASAIGVTIRAKGMEEVARQTGRSTDELKSPFQ